MSRHLCGVGLVLSDAVVSSTAYGLGAMTAEAAAFAAGVSLAGLVLTALALADCVLPAAPADPPPFAED